MSAPQALVRSGWIRSGQTGSWRQENVPLAASQTIRQGDIVRLDSGAATQALALPETDNTATESTGNLNVYGIALAPATTGADPNGRTLPVAVFDDNLECALRLYDADPDDAKPTDLVRGTAFRLARYRADASGGWFYTLTRNTTNGEAIYTAAFPDSDPDQPYGLVWVKVRAASRQGG